MQLSKKTESSSEETMVRLSGRSLKETELPYHGRVSQLLRYKPLASNCSSRGNARAVVVVSAISLMYCTSRKQDNIL
ncbi:hypothetical protein M440DRAFT_1249583 [Trichoderma longibrachiatum ATCC 18648]|uniref:Uncharacterized protein n=1 Tax=Trichoderma longibrachiatum ATCC 18648 TaxID=983965 RepID=A0A2T4C420_TRILO|nr:hypothetical protein M440DRAFT_1249583 [Trichoderma longibrachiatum ATCC 18648]